MTKKYEVLEKCHSDGLSQSEIAERLGVSRARVSFLERQAMRKLRAAADDAGYSLDDVLREVWR